MSLHLAVSLGFWANFENIPEQALTPLSIDGSSCNFQDLKGRHTVTITGLDIILEAVLDFLSYPEMGGYLHPGLIKF